MFLRQFMGIGFNSACFTYIPASPTVSRVGSGMVLRPSYKDDWEKKGNKFAIQITFV